MTNLSVRVIERGWAGHFICSNKCTYRRNTLLDNDKQRLVVSTVGGYHKQGKLYPLSQNRYYETRVFVAKQQNGVWRADTSQELTFTHTGTINAAAPECLSLLADQQADEMHDAVVAELVENLFINNI